MMAVQTDCRYDLNVIYNHARSRLSSTEDTNLSQNIAENLVMKAESWGFNRTYYHDRDALPGKNMFTELFNVIKGSKFTVVILTKGFLKNCWSQYCHLAAFKTLLEKDHAEKLIPIVVGLKRNEIPENLLINHIIYFDIGTWSADTPQNKKEWQKLKDCLAGTKQTGESAPDQGNFIEHRPIQNTEAPVKTDQAELASLLRVENLHLRQHGQAVPDVSQNNNSLNVDGPVSSLRDTGDGAEAEASSASNVPAESNVVLATEHGSHTMTRGATLGSAALPNTDTRPENSVRHEHINESNARQFSGPTSRNQHGNSRRAAAPTTAATTTTSTAAATKTSVRNANCNSENSNIDRTGSMDFSDLTVDNGSLSTSCAAPPPSNNVNDNDKAKCNRNYSNLGKTDYTGQENQPTTVSKANMNKQRPTSRVNPMTSPPVTQTAASKTSSEMQNQNQICKNGPKTASNVGNVLSGRDPGDTSDSAYNSYSEADLGQAPTLDPESILRENSTDSFITEVSSETASSNTREENVPNKTPVQPESAVNSTKGASSDRSMIHRVGQFLSGPVLRMATSPDQIYLG